MVIPFPFLTPGRLLAGDREDGKDGKDGKADSGGGA